MNDIIIVKFCGSSRLLVSRVSSWSSVSRDWVPGDASGRYILTPTIRGLHGS